MRDDRLKTGEIQSNIRILVSVSIVVLGMGADLSVCFANDNSNETSTWPPDAAASEARSNLQLREDALNTVALRMIASPYVMVIEPVPGEISARRADSEDSEMEIPVDKDVWSELLTAAGIRSVLRNDDDVHFTHITQDEALVDGIAFNHMYVWSKENTTYECLPQFADFDCGQCGERFAEDWTVVFAWMPSDIAEWPEEDGDKCIDDFISAMHDKPSPFIQN